MMNHTNQQIILPPRPPIINFHTEESLWAVSKKKLVKVAKREGVKYTHMRKDGIIANILEHQGGRDMTGRRFVPISVWKFFVEFHKFRLVDTANANPQGRRYLSLSWRPIVVLLVFKVLIYSTLWLHQHLHSKLKKSLVQLVENCGRRRQTFRSFLLLRQKHCNLNKIFVIFSSFLVLNYWSWRIISTQFLYHFHRHNLSFTDFPF